MPRKGNKMPSIKTTVWPIDPHTQAKHEILKNYLKAWFPILGSTCNKIMYLDGFAGPGIYQNGEEGSPVIALKTSIEHVLQSKFKAKRKFLFIEKDIRRANILRQVLKERFPELPEKVDYNVWDGEFAPTLSSVLDFVEKEGGKLAPTFAFLDPFGFSGMPMELIGRLLRFDMCEVMITFMSGFVNRFCDELREETLDELFATKKWRDNRDIKIPDKRKRFLLDLYKVQLQSVGGATYTRSFEMVGEHNQTIYHLVYGTKHWVGLKAMKEAMWKVDKRGTYKFSDITDVGQKFLIDYSKESHWVPKAADMVFNEFKSQTRTINDIEQFVVINTPYIFRKSILKHLEKMASPKITEVVSRKRKYTYPNGCSIHFLMNKNLRDFDQIL